MDQDPASTPPSAPRLLQRWLRAVGGFYVLVGVFNLPPVIEARFPMQYPDLGIGVDSAPAQALVDVWFMFGLEIAVTGVALLLAARNPVRHVALVWLVLGLEVVRGIVDDLYLLARGYDVGIYVGWIVLHAVIIVTGLLALRRAGLLPRRDARRAPSEVEA